MDRISELLDDIGWAQQDEWKEAAFKWMTEATNRIQELQAQVEGLQRDKANKPYVADLAQFADQLETRLIEKGLL